MRERKVYLAGPVSSLSGVKATGWRRRFIDEMAPYEKWDCIDPLRSQAAALQKEKCIRPTGYGGVVKDSVIFSHCKYDVNRCEALFVNLMGAKQVSIGTVAEMTWAHTQGKFIVLCMEDGNIHDHCFVKQMASIIFPSYADGFRYLAEEI